VARDGQRLTTKADDHSDSVTVQLQADRESHVALQRGTKRWWQKLTCIKSLQQSALLWATTGHRQSQFDDELPLP